MKCIAKLCFLLILLFIDDQLSASLLEPKFRHYSTEHGLSHDGVLCITEDSEGFMWFGTWDGINRFDGNNFITYKARPGDNSSLRNNKVRDITEDKSGYLWIKTYDRKVYRFSKASEDFIAIQKSNRGENLEHLFIDKVVPLSNGDVWLITENNGVVCVLDRGIDSLEVINYDSERSIFGNNNVNFIFEDANQRIWFGTKKGLFCLVKRDGKYISYLSPKTTLYGANLNFTSVSARSSENIFFSSSNGIIVEFKASDKTFYSRKIASGINSILVSKSGVVYATCSKQGLLVYNPKVRSVRKFEKYGSLSSLYEDKNGNLWLEPEGKGAILYKPADDSFQSFTQNREHSLPYVGRNTSRNDKSFYVFEDVNGQIWVGLKGGGFGYYNEREGKLNYFYNNPEDSDRLFSNNIVTAYSDKKGVLWFSERNGGIYKAVFSPGNFNHKQLVPNSANKYENEVRALFQDSDGKVWISNKFGKLYVYRNGTERINVLGGYKGTLGSIYCIIEDRNKNIWIGTKGQGLIRLQPKDTGRLTYSISRYENNPNDLTSISNNQIYSVLEDKLGRIWVGTFGGGLNLVVEDGKQIKFKNINNSLNQYPRQTFNVIRHIIQGPEGFIWLATTDGILRFNPDENLDNAKFAKTIKLRGDKYSLGNNDVQYMYKSVDNEIWLGTFGGGLHKVIHNPKTLSEDIKFKVYTKEDGLPNDIILSMIEDNDKNLWIATENGISKLDKKDEVFRNYGIYDGLPRMGFSEAACFKSDKGEIFFGGINGYISFHPAKIRNEKYQANMAFTGIQLYNKDINIKAEDSPIKLSINYADKIVFKHNQDVVTFEYAVLDNRVPHNVSYAYILEGYDKNWHYVKNQRKAIYTQLPPGDYVFKVRAIDNHYFENVPEKSVAIKVKNPWWLSSWAVLTYLTLAVLALEIIRRIAFTLIKLKNKVVVEEKLAELKVQFFTNISHELRTPLTLIVNPLQKIASIEHLSKDGVKYLGIANKNVGRMIRYVNQLLDFRKIQSQNLKLRVEKIELVDFISKLTEYFAEILEEKEISLKLTSSAEEILVWCDRDKMDIVFFNIISNAIKFTPKKRNISVKIEKLDAKVQVQVIDEGVGVSEHQLEDIFKLYYEGDNQQDSAYKGTGIGLALAKEIVSLHKGSINAYKNNEEGMTFTVELMEGNLHFDVSEILDEDKWKEPEPLYNLPPYKNEQVSTTTDIDRTSFSKLLLVEDNTELRKFIVDQFKDYYDVYEAENGKEGYLKAIELLPDAIISDVMMPELNGIDMLEKLKNDVATSHIPVILLTAKSTIEDQIKGLSYGADFYVTKPFHADYIKYLLENLIKNRQKIVSNIIDKPTILKLEPSEVIITSKDEAFLKDVIKTVEEKMSDFNFNIDSVANSMAMGRTTFYKKLKSLTNMTPVEFVKDIRLKRGKQLLDTGELNVTEVAYQVGFNSSGYFSTCFKEKYKVSPSDYLKNTVANKK